MQSAIEKATIMKDINTALKTSYAVSQYIRVGFSLEYECAGISLIAAAASAPFFFAEDDPSI